MRSFLDHYNENSQLMTAVLDRNLKGVQESLRGAQANVVNPHNGYTAIGMAAAMGEEEILRLLIQSCEEKNTLLIQYDAENPCPTPEGMDKLEWEDEFPHEYATEENSSNDEHTSLYYYYAKTLEVTGHILTGIKTGLQPKILRKEDPHIPDDMHMTPLHYAAAFGHTRCVEALIERGAKVNCENADGYTPLHLGTKFPNVTLMLLRNGANPNIKTIHTLETVLHSAIRNRCIESVRFILMHGYAKLDEVDIDDRTPLMCAIRNDCDDIAMILLENGARINLLDRKGRTALYYAVIGNKEHIVKYLLRNRARRLPEHYLLHNCVRLNLKEMVELLVIHGDNLYLRNPNGLTPAMMAIVCKNADMLEFLLLMASKQALRPDEFFYLGTELFLAVDNTNNLSDFQPLARVLFAYTTITYDWATENGLEVFPSCFDRLCSTALAHAIERKKLNFAEFLIKEGMDVSLTCREHNAKHLRLFAGEPGVLEFTKFLVYCGFKFPYRAPPYPNFWWPERAQLETELYKLCTNPLPLKALARMSIRKCLTQKPFGDRTGINSDPYRLKQLESVIQYRIKELGLPKSLQNYLYDFPDCETKF